MEPRLPVKTHVDVGVLYLKRTLPGIESKISGCVCRKSRNAYVAWCLLLLGLFGRTASATEIVIKVVGNVIYVAADSLVERAGQRFATCKILRVKDGNGGIYFSFSGHTGSLYNIRRSAMDIGAESSSLSQADSSFDYLMVPLITAFARADRLSPQVVDEVAFYGIERGAGKAYHRIFNVSFDESVARESNTCPPDCGNFIDLSSSGILKTWADSHRRIYAKPPAELVECLVREMIHLPQGRGEVGGAVSVARIDSEGLTWVDGKRGACKSGPEEQYENLEPDPPACDLR